MSNELQDIVLGNRYNLIEKIGEGGMALVYKAKDQLLNRFVAVKILRPEFTADEEFIKKFKRESLAAASLSHPNVVGIYDVGDQEGIYYIVMEYVNGKTLKEYIKEIGKLNYREALNITNQIANALDHAHKNGVIHRDIKPHNILVTEDKMIKVTDFGIARASNSSTIANTGSVMGSVHYFSPEQARGGYSDHRTDIYSLGVVLYEMLTGSLPYDAESPVTIALKHIQEDFVQPTIMDNTIPAGINDIVVKAMEKDMNDRYQTIKELIDDIEIARINPYQKIVHKENVSQLTQIIPVEQIDEAINKSNKTNKENKKKKSKKIIIITVSILVFCIALISAAIYGYNKFFLVKDTTIPQIIGMTVDEGKAAITNDKLVFVKGPDQNSDQPKGQITKVSPEVGDVVKVGSTVTVTVSSGQEQVKVPDLTNKSIDEAKFALSQYNLSIGNKNTANSDLFTKGKIISQNPPADSSVSKGSSVEVTISDGPLIKLVTVPELTGKTKDQAISALKALKLGIGNITYEQNSNYGNNIVTAVGIPAGKQVTEGTPIDLIINNVDTNSTNNTNNTDNTNNTNSNDPNSTDNTDSNSSLPPTN